MRVSNRAIMNMVLQDINRNLRALSRTMDQMASGKKVSRPSDGPITVAQALSFRSVIAEQEQHVKNMQDGVAWVDVSESALANATEVLQRARELAIYGASDTLPQESRNALAEEVDQLIDELVQIANSTCGGRYVFGGTKTTDRPFVKDSEGGSVSYRGDEHYISYEVSPGVTVEVNIPGEQVFRVDGGTSQLFGTLIKLRDVLKTGSSQEIGSVLGDLSADIDHILEQRAVFGAKSNRLRLAIDRTTQAKIEMTALMSRVEDVDMAEVAMYFHIQQAAYQAALMTGARILQPSLLDFLR